jgi:hypothetical protein
MTAELLARLGGPVGAGGLAIVLLAPAPRIRLAGLLIWAAGMSMFVPLLAPAGNRALLGAAAVGGLVVGIGLAYLFRRSPWALAFLTLIATPVRIPVSLGDDSANLLVPLYAVISGAVLALAWSLWRGDERRRELGRLSWPLAAFVAWLGLSALWTEDPTKGAVELFFFVLPFPLLALALARLPWSERALRWLAGLLGAMALLFAAVGLGQWVAKDVFWNPNVVAENAYGPFFRVNSLFWDPSIYGRFLVLTILVALALVLFGPSDRRRDLLLALGIAVLWVALLFTFSQSSFAALVAGAFVAGALAWRRRDLAVAAAAVLLLGAAAQAGEPIHADSVAVAGSGSNLDRATRGRSALVWNGLRIAAAHPVVGVGVGGFERAYLEDYEPPPGLENPVSHTTPVTIVAENGIVGLALFGWLLAAAALLALRRLGREPPSLALTRVTAGICITTVFVHSLFYNAFLEDPLTWGFMALAVLAIRTRAERS